LDRVDDDADRLGELVEERLVRGAELLEGGELDDGLDLPLEEHGEDDDARGGGAAEAGADAEVLRRDALEEDALALGGALPDEALAEAEVLGEVPVLVVGVAGEEAQARLVLARVHQEEGAVVGGDE